MKKKTTILALLLFSVVLIGARTMMVGSGWYALDFDTSDSTQTFTASSKLWFYQDKQFYFNSGNRAKSPVDHEGGLGLLVTCITDTIDSNSVVLWATDYDGNIVNKTDSIDLITSTTLYPGDTLLYNLTDSTLFKLLYGMKVRMKHQATEATAKDSTWTMKVGVIIK